MKKKITIIFMSVLMIFASCSMNTSYDNSNEIEEKTNTEKEDDSENNKDESLNEEPKEDDSENNENEHFNEDDSENKVVEDKTWCEIDENINILELNYIGYYENFTAIFNSDSNDSELV